MSVKVTIPDFNFSGFYYPEILEDLIQYMRVNCPEITDESPEEPFIQLLRAFALTAHMNNVLLDMVAKERFLPTAALRESIAAHLALIDYKLSQTSPATADILLELALSFTSTTEVVPALALFSTAASAATPAIDYEVAAAVSTARTDQITSCLSFDKYNSDNGFGPWSNLTSNVLTQSGGGIALFSNHPVVGSYIAVCHADVMFDAIYFLLTGAGANISGLVWEYYNGGVEQDAPTSVTNNGATLTFDLTSILGASNRSGAVVRVRCQSTNNYEDMTTTWVGGKNVATTTTLLGQTSPSLTPSDYIAGSEWRELSNVVDGTSNFTLTGARTVSFTLPQDVDNEWNKTTLNGATGYWIRSRIVTTAGAVTWPFADHVRIDTGKTYLMASAVQGNTVNEAPLGSSTGLADQTFQLANYPVLDDSNLAIIVEEGGVEQRWTRVDDFLSSGPTDTHFTVAWDDESRVIVTFGDGNTGKVPEAGTDNIRAIYRVMLGYNGNVGADSINVNKSGVSYVDRVWNPRAASGYSPRDGSTDADLARLKIAGPASLRTKERALNGADMEELAINFTAPSSGSKSVKRALAIEGAYGPKTVQLVVVGDNGGPVPDGDFVELGYYFNGNEQTKTPGAIVMNTEATITKFTPKSVDIYCVVYGGNQAAIEAALTNLLNPLAVESDGVTWTWDFGGTVPRAHLIQAIMNTTPRPRNITLNTPAVDVTLAQVELPMVGTLSLQMFA